MSWANLGALAIGAAVAVVGGLFHVEALIGIGSTIVGGVLGTVVPKHGHMTIPPPAPPEKPPRRRTQRRIVLTPAAANPFGPESTERNRVPPGTL